MASRAEKPKKKSFDLAVYVDVYLDQEDRGQPH